jgi:hypothetical protein
MISFFEGFPNPWDVILNKRRYEYAMVGDKKYFSSSNFVCMM